MPIMCRVFWPNGLDGFKGPFHLGKFSWPINVASLAFIGVMSIFFILPTVSPPPFLSSTMDGLTFRPIPSLRST